MKSINDMPTFSGMPSSQNPFEINAFCELLGRLKVRSYLEVGARHGDSFVHVMESLPEGSTGVAVDLPGALWGRNNSRQSLERAVDHLRKKGYKASAIFGDSTSTAVKRLVVGRGPYDAALLDGDHTLEGCTKDWEAYGDLARVVAFHDIVGTGCRERVHGNTVQVPLLWSALKETRDDLDFAEFVAPGSRMGIGATIKRT